jgi:opacity protein-like surface antigen
MKNPILRCTASIIIAFTSLQGTAFAQVEKGNILIDTYYGGPNLWKSVLETFFVDNGSSNVQVGGIGPVGGRFEFMMADKVGIGADYNYTSVGISWSDADSSSSTIYNYDIKSKRNRFMARINIHFATQGAFDAYFGLGAGYNSVKYEFTSNRPGWDESIPGLNPLAFRIALGARYYFIPNLGANMELGLFGGAIVHGGISLKF